MNPYVQRTTLMATVWGLACAGLAGCASTSPDHDARFGEAVKQLAELQRIHPQASTQNEGKALGADGRTAQAGVERMLGTYRDPIVPTAQAIGTVGTTVGTGR